MGVDVPKKLRDISEKEVDVRQKLQDDGMSRSQIFGSNGHPSSQPRKISIGIIVDKKKLEAAEKDEAKIPNVERMNLNKENSMQAENKCEDASAATKGKQSEATEEVRSAWTTKRFFHQNAPISDTVPCTNQPSSRPATGQRQKKLNRVKDAQLAHSVQFFANQSSILQSGDGNQKKFTGITYSRKEGKSGSQVQVEKFTFATAQEAIILDKVVAADKTDKTENRTETLRTKLWQILATVSSPKSQPSNSQANETCADNLKQEQLVDQLGDRIVRPRQNSDTIETDSESPMQPTCRHLTQSLNRKRASTKVPQEKTKLGSSSSAKQKHQMNIYSFQDGRSVNLDGTINFGSLMSTLKKSQIKKSIIEPHEISFAEKVDADKPQLASNNSESSTHADKTLDHKEDSFHGCPPQNKTDYCENNNKIQDKDFHQPSDLKKMYERADSLASAGTREHQEDCGNSSSKNAVEPPDAIQSPTFAFKSPTLSPSPCSTLRTVQMEQDVHDPALEYRRFSLQAIRSFRTLQTSKPDCSRSDAETEPPGDAEELQHFSPRKPSPLKEKKDAEDDLAEFLSEDGHLGSSEDGSPIIKGYDYNQNISPEIHTSEEPNSMHCHTKQLCNHQGIRVDQFSPTPPSTKDIGEREWFLEPSAENQEDELARAVTLFAVGLENFRRKMDAATKRKSSEILLSVSEGIHLQLQNVESQIQTDIGKLTGLSKSKRKRLETRFEEQQEQLWLTHQKFKEDIHHHIQNCQHAIEELEAHQIELKGTVKKQRSSHQKLMLQVEEAVETLLNDAQRRITAVHESARNKMLQLKHVIADSLKEQGVLN